MSVSGSFKILIYNSTKGVEFAVYVNGKDAFGKAVELLHSLDAGALPKRAQVQPDQTNAYYFLNDDQLAALGAFMKQTN